MKVFLVPRKDVIVREPNSYTPLPAEGSFVDWNGNAGRFWRRRVKCGDVTIEEPKEVEKVKEVEAAEPLLSKPKRSNK